MSDNELGEGVPDVDDVGGGLGVALVLLQINGDHMIEIVGLGHRNSQSWDLPSLHRADFTMVENF